MTNRLGGRDDGHEDEDRLYLGGPIEGGRLVVSTSLGRQDLVYDTMFRTLLVIGIVSTPRRHPRGRHPWASLVDALDSRIQPGSRRKA